MTDRHKSPALTPLQKDILEILQFKFKNSRSPVEQQIYDFQKNYKQYSTVDQSTFSMQINEIPIKEVLIQVGFQVPFNYNIISLLKNHTVQNPQSISEIIIYEILTQGLAYLVSNEKRQDALVLLLSIFPCLLPISQYQNKIISVYTLVLKEYSSSHHNTITDDIHKSILTFLKFFLNNEEKLPETFSESFFLYMMKISTYEKITKICDLFDLIEQFMTSGKLFFSIADNQSFFDIISPFISKLHFSAIKLMFAVARSSNDIIPNIQKLFEIMADGLNSKIIQKDLSIKTVFIEQNLTEFPALREFNEIDYETVFKNLPNFEYNESEVNNLFTFEGQFKNSLNFTPEHVQNYITIISNNMVNVSEKYIMTFMAKIMKSAELHENILFYADFFTVVVFFSNRIETNLDDSIIRFLMSSIIFHSSNFSSFSVENTDPLYYYHYLRHSVFLLLIKQGHSRSRLVKVLLAFAAKMSPFIYSEILLYFLKNLNQFENLSLFCTEKQLESFMSVSIELQNMYSVANDTNCQLARTICFDYFFKLINDAESLPIISATANFSKGIANFIFERSLSNLFIDQLTAVFLKFQVNLNNPPFYPIIPVFREILESCTLNVRYKEYKDLGTTIIGSVFKLVRKNPKLVVTFYSNFHCLLNFFKATKEIAFLDEIFNVFLVALNYIQNFEISYEIFDLVIDFLNDILVEKSELINKLQLSFLSLLAGKEIHSIDQPFLIRNPQIIPFFISSFSKYKNFEEIISFFFGICQYSPSNVVACHDGDLDYFLIFFMKKELSFCYHGHSLNFTFDLQKCQSKIFETFSTILRVKTSSFICNQLFEMLIPTSPIYQADEVERNLELIEKVAEENMSKMKPIYSLITNKTLCNVTGVTDKHLNSDFAFSFWIKIDVPQMMEIPDEYTICHIKDGHNTQYKVYLRSNYLNIKIVSNKGERENRKKKELPSNEWVLITFVQQKIETEFIMKFYINNVSIEQIGTNNFQFHPGNIAITFGTSASSSERYANLKIGEIGPFCFSKTINLTAVTSDKNFERMNDIYFSSAMKINPHIHSSFDIVNLRENESKSSLNDILIEYIDLNYLTYVYSKFKVNKQDQLFKFLKIILALLASSQHAQKSYKSTLFLAQTIANLFGRRLNYEIFIEIYMTLEKLTNQKLIIKFFDYLIFNMDLWCLADTTSIVSIIKHLNYNSNRQFSSLFQHICGISRLLSIYRLSFFKNDLKCALFPFQHFHLPVEIDLIKNEFFNFMESIGRFSLNYQDVQTIYAHLFASQNKAEKIDILTYISRLNHNITNFKNIQFDLISPLFKLLLSDDIDIIINTILTIKSISFDFCHLYFSIISVPLIEYSQINSLFQILLKIVNESENVDLYSLICALALLRGKKKIIPAINLLDRLSENECRMEPALDDCFMWSVWPICIALQGTRSQRKVVARFLCKQITRKTVAEKLIQNFTKIYCLIEYLSQHNKTAAYYTQMEFTLQVLHSIFNTSNAEVECHKINFLILAFSCTFFHPQYFRNRPFNNAFLQSPFRDCFLEVKHSNCPQSNENNENSSKNVAKNNDDNDKGENSVKKRFKNFDDLYFSPRETVKDINLVGRNAKDYSGKRCTSDTYFARPKYQSDLIHNNNSMQKLLADDDDDEENDDDEGIKNHEELSQNMTCRSFVQLLKLIQQPSLKQQHLIFQMKIADDEVWVDSLLCDKLVHYSSRCQISQDSVEHSLISDFIQIVGYFKQKKIIVDSNEDEGLMQKKIRILSQKFEEAIASVQSKLKVRLDQDNAFELLNKALARALECYDNIGLFHACNKTYLNDFSFEVKRSNELKIELSEINHFIQKNFVRCRNSSVFLKRNDITNNMNNININNKNNENYNASNDTKSENEKNKNKNNDSNNNNNNVNDSNNNNNNVNDSNNNNNNVNDSNNNNNNVNDRNNNNSDVNDNNNKLNVKKESGINNNSGGDDACIDVAEMSRQVYSEIYKDKDFIYKRDNCLCNGFCPIKLRPKYINEDHTVDLIDEREVLKAVFDNLRQPPSDNDDITTEESKSDDNDSEYSCKIIKIGHEIPTKLCFLKNQIVLMSLSTSKIVVIPFKLVRHIYRRKRYQQDRAVEIVLINGKSYFIDFGRHVKSRYFFAKIQKLNFPLAKTIIVESPMNSMANNRKITSMWENGIISNFSYILTLNMISGRSFNDVTQYPIFPLILKRNPKTKKSSHSANQTQNANENTNQTQENTNQTQENTNQTQENASQMQNTNENTNQTQNTNEITSQIQENASQTQNTNENAEQTTVTNERLNQIPISSISLSHTEVNNEKVSGCVSESCQKSTSNESNVGASNSAEWKPASASDTQKAHTIVFRDLSKCVNSQMSHATEEDPSSINREIDSMFNPSPLPPDIVDRFMMRVEPFTTLHLHKQNWRFTDKTVIHNIEMIYKEKCELLPEFYFFPEFLMNINELPIKCQHYIFPKFKQTPQNSFEFIYRHRKLLEKKEISQALHRWIDQIWGYKQHELSYHPYVFEDIWELKSSSLTTAEEKIVSMMRLYGVMPAQLFTMPHSKRSDKLDLTKIMMPAMSHPIRQRANTTHSIFERTSLPSLLPHRPPKLETVNVQKSDNKNMKVNESPHLLTSSSSSFFGLNDSNILNDLLFESKDIVRHNLNNNSIIRFAVPLSHSSFFFIDTDGNAFEVQVMMKAVKNKKQIDREIVKGVTHLSSIENGFVMLSTFNDNICVQNNIFTSYLANNSSDLNMIIGSQNFFLTIQNHSILTLFDTVSPENDGQIVSIESTIVDCQIDQSFGLIIFLSSDDILHIHSIHNMLKVNAIDLRNFHPKKCIISCKWGFILVHCRRHLLIFDVNGFLIKKVEFSYNVLYWNSIRSYKDFDFIVFESDRQEVGMFEAFNPLQTLSIITTVNAPVCAIDFFREQNCLAVLTKEGEVVVISHIFPRH